MVRKKKAEKPEKEMSFFDHLEELRWRLIKSVIAIVVCAIPCGIFWKQIVNFSMIYPLRLVNPKPKLIYTAPAEAVSFSLLVTLFGGCILAAPVIFYQIWRFVVPGLYKKEQRIVLPVVIATTLFFFLGIVFSYALFPYLMNALSTFAAGTFEPFFKINEYVSFLIKLSLAFGLVFELPVIAFVLARMGIIDARFLVRHLRIAIVIIFVVAAVLSPPDVLSQLIMSAPLLILYGMSILIAYFAAKKKKTEEV